MTTTEKLCSVLSDESFYNENKDLKDPEAIVKAIQLKVPEATEIEIDNFLTEVSVAANEAGELKEGDLENVAGGFAVTITVAGVITAVKCAAAAGTVIGGAIWYWQNRKK